MCSVFGVQAWASSPRQLASVSLASMLAVAILSNMERMLRQTPYKKNEQLNVGLRSAELQHTLMKIISD